MFCSWHTVAPCHKFYSTQVLRNYTYCLAFICITRCKLQQLNVIIESCHLPFQNYYSSVSSHVLPSYEDLPKISENLLVITWILTLSPNFHCHLWSSHLGLVYNDLSDFATFGSTHWSLPASAWFVSVAILLGPLQWRRNVVLSTRVSF